MVNATMEALTSAKSFNESHRRSSFRFLFDPIGLQVATGDGLSEFGAAGT
jgi:hypothetical protein